MPSEPSSAGATIPRRFTLRSSRRRMRWPSSTRRVKAKPPSLLCNDRLQVSSYPRSGGCGYSIKCRFNCRLHEASGLDPPRGGTPIPNWITVAETRHSREPYRHLVGCRCKLRFGKHPNKPETSPTDWSRDMKLDKTSWALAYSMLLLGVPVISALLTLGLARHGVISAAHGFKSLLLSYRVATPALRKPSITGR